MKKNTLIVNLFGGPGCGKSTGAAWLFSRLKLAGIDCELVTEFAKDKVWEDNQEVFNNQFYITGKQSFKISRCFGKVDVIITDSPIAIGSMYCDENKSPKLKEAIFEDFNRYRDNNFNILLRRVKDYNPNGRNQTEDEAKNIDDSTRNWLTENEIPFIVFDGDEDGYSEILNIIKETVYAMP